MLRTAWITVYAAIALTILFLFLGAVAYQSGDSISVAHQQSVLNSFGTVLRADLYGVEDQDALLRSHKIMESPEISAFILSSENEILGRSWTQDPPFGLPEVISTMAEEPDLKSYQRTIDLEDARLVWLDIPLAEAGHRLILVHQCVNFGVGDLASLYVLPIGFAAMLVIWASFWAAMMVRRMIRSHARMQELEVDLVRQQEAGKIQAAFFANMSHELRTPLNAIIGFSEMLKMQVFGSTGSTRNASYIANIHAAGTLLLQLVDRLLDMSRMEAEIRPLSLEPVDVRAMLEDCSAMKALQANQRTVDLTTRCPENFPALFVDAIRIKQALMHLVDNALKYTDEGGEISLAASLLADSRIQITVEDDGHGIDHPNPQSLLTDFAHARSNAEVAKPGAGVGLPFSNALIAQHGGSITITSETGKGTTVNVTFPAERTLMGTVPEEQDTTSNKTPLAALST